MSFFDKLTAFLPSGRKDEPKEYFFALNIGLEKLTGALWVIEGKSLKVLEIASQNYSSNSEIVSVTDRLLDQVLGLREIEPQKILFGVPDSWILDDNLKDEYLKLLRSLVKELELTPMAYVATSHAIIHFLEKQEGIPTTAVLVGLQKLHLIVTVVRAGKLDGVKAVTRGESAGSDIEKALLSFTDVGTLPSKILLYGMEAEQLRPRLLSFSWMSKLNFLHFPKIEVLEDNLEIKGICLAGGSEINSDIKFVGRSSNKSPVKSTFISGDEEVVKKNIDKEKEEIVDEAKESSQAQETDESTHDKTKEPEPVQGGDDFGFVVGDVADQIKSEDRRISESEKEDDYSAAENFERQERGQELVVPQERSLEIDDFEREITPPVEHQRQTHKKKFSFTSLVILLAVISTIAFAGAAYAFLSQATVKIFVEPEVLEKDAQVVADPNQKSVNEDGKIIPGQIVETEVSGSAKDSASGKRQIGDPSKGTVTIRNKTDSGVTLSKGTVISQSEGLKFSLDLSVNVASRSAEDGTWGKATGTVTALSIGADGNLPSGSDFTVAGYGTDKVIAKSEGNFSGGTSKDVTVVSSEDQQKLLAKLSSDLRQQAQQKLQEKFPGKKILEEALSEKITSKSYSKNINDQASEFSLNMTVRFKGTAFEDQDLKLIVSKLINTQVPEGFELDLAETETQADISKLEKDGKLIFLARFKAKLLPKIDTEKIKNEIKFKAPAEVIEQLKGMDNVLGSEIKITPDLPEPLRRLPLLSKNIKIEVGLK